MKSLRKQLWNFNSIIENFICQQDKLEEAFDMFRTSEPGWLGELIQSPMRIVYLHSNSHLILTSKIQQK